jgi:alpha-L-fucosidase
MSKLFPFIFITVCAVYNSGALVAQSTSIPVPTTAQITWHQTEFYLFFHFGPNTFTNLEWGHGTETEEVFNPANLDCDQWCAIAKAAGAKGVVVTAKHHDGFCLWPSRYSKHTVRESKWRDGKGDVLRELSDACRRHGLKFGVYLSPWDRNHPKYGTPEYNDVYANTLVELLTGYGELFEVWWDGANGEGPNGKKQVYDFPRFEKLVRQYQPNAVIFSDIGPGCRWAGNEQGTVAETNWCMLDTAGFGRGATGPAPEVLQTGQENGKAWIPAECDVSIRPGWFYHAEEDTKVKSPETLFDIYLKSVGRGANLILNVPPDRNGRIHPTDSTNLVAFGQRLKAAFATNLVWKKMASVTSKNPAVSNRILTDGSPETAYLFSLRPGQPLGAVEIDLEAETSFNCVKLNEKVRRNGQQIKLFSIEILENNEWREIARSTTVGVRKMVTFPVVTTRKLRVKLLDAKGDVALGEIQVFKMP